VTIGDILATVQYIYH